MRADDPHVDQGRIIHDSQLTTHNSGLVWFIGSSHGRSPELVDNYKEPTSLGDVVWKAAGSESLRDQEQRWPIFHPSEADPEGGYRFHPYTIEFRLDDEPVGAYLFCIQYLVIAPRLARLEIELNGAIGCVYLRPTPSRSHEIGLLAGLHTSIYAEGICEVVIPASLLRRGANRMTLVAQDDGEVVRVEGIERIRRLDRMANGAGFIYQHLTFSQIPCGSDLRPEEVGLVARVEVKPSVVYRLDETGTLWERCHLYLELNRGTAGQERDLTLLREADGQKFCHRLDVPEVAFGHLHFPFDLADGAGPVRYTLCGRIGGEEIHAEGEFEHCRKWKVFVAPHVHADIGYTHRQWEVAERLCRNIDRALDMLEPSLTPQPPMSDTEVRATEDEGRGGLMLSPPLPMGGYWTRQGGEGIPGVRDAYHLDSSWTLETYLATRGERRKRQLFDQVRAGRFGIPSGYVDLLTQFAALEDLIRNGEFTESILRPEGLRTDFTTVVDVASISGSLPAILVGSGVRYLVHADNQDRGPFRLYSGLHRISPYYWEGVNGGRALVWLAKMYCELRKVCGSPPVPDAAERGLQLWLDEYERPDYAPDAVLLYGQEADNTDLDPQPGEFIQRWNETYAYPRLIPCAVSEYFRYVEERFGDTFETVRGDGGAYWEDGVLSHVVSMAMVRDAQAMLLAAETLAALAVMHAPDLAYPLVHFDEAWRQILLFDEHTWGAFLSSTDPDSLLQQDQWAVKEHIARSALQWSTRLLHSAATRHSLSWNTTGREVVVYNPHSWSVSGPVVVEIGRDETVVEAGAEREVPMRQLRTTSTQAQVELWIDDLPGLSYRRFPLRETRAEASHGRRSAEPPSPPADEPTSSVSATPPLSEHQTEKDVVPAERGVNRGVALHQLANSVSGMPDKERRRAVLENAHYRLEVDLARGCVAGWFDKELARELVDPKAPWGFGQFLYARGGEGTRLTSNRTDLPDGNPEVLSDFHPIHGSAALRGQLSLVESEGQALRMIGEVPGGVLEIEWTLCRDGDRGNRKYVDVRYTYRKEERLSKEAAYIAFPLNLPGARALSDSQLGWVDWDRDALPGACSEWLPLQTGILVHGEETDVLICSPDIPLFCVGDIVRGRWPKDWPHSGRLTGGHVLSYVLNNYWHTNYKASQGGEISFRYRLTSDRRIEKDRAYRLGWETRRPLYAHRISFQDFREPVGSAVGGQAAPAAGPYADPRGGNFVRIGPEQVALSTIKQARWSADSFILRLQEIAGLPQRATVEFPALRIVSAWSCDLLERDSGKLEVEPDGTLRVDVPAWGLATVRISTAPRGSDER